ncbi:solute carrier family 23 protein, partial [Anaerotruncus colihominis]|uniref:solute carrier family 23 protein n=1 Tax=Anaerotruncus colihominis TaxID=169435 RepID=UPI00273064D0
MGELMGDQASAAMLAQNRLPSDRETRGGNLAQGISSVISSAFNMVPTISGSANIGLCGISGVTSRFITAVAGVVVALCGLCPKLCAVFSAIPE